MTNEVIPLAAGFRPADRADWLALVEKTLKGQGAETLVGRNADGLPVAPLYTAADLPGVLPTPVRALPDDRAWDIRAVVCDPDPAGANAQALEALAGGAGSLLMRLDTGAGGLRAAGPEALAQALDGVMAEIATVALDAGFLGPHAAGWLSAFAKASPTARLALHLDPLSAFAAAGASPGPIDAHVAAAARAAADLAETYPKASLFLASGTAAHEAGGSPAWELALAAAAAVAYVRALAEAGLPMRSAFAGITLGLAVDAEPLGGIAKLRAARLLWRRIVQACGVDVPARIEARSSRRMLTRADRWTNLVRLTSAGFAAAVGGADAVVLGAFTDAIGAPDGFALRMARNTQLILMEEAHLGRVADPAAGAFALEAQTSDLARAAWRAFVDIEAAGGLARALESGLVADAVATSREALRTALAERSLRLLGVTDFPPDEPAPEAAAGATVPPDLPDLSLAGGDSRCPALSPIRLEEMAR